MRGLLLTVVVLSAGSLALSEEEQEESEQKILTTPWLFPTQRDWSSTTARLYPHYKETDEVGATEREMRLKELLHLLHDRTIDFGIAQPKENHKQKKYPTVKVPVNDKQIERMVDMATSLSNQHTDTSKNVLIITSANKTEIHGFKNWIIYRAYYHAIDLDFKEGCLILYHCAARQASRVPGKNPKAVTADMFVSCKVADKECLPK